MKKISVIIPCYNVSAYIDRCMTSIVNQTMGMDCLEIICVDDASRDDTWEKLQSWECRFPEDILLIRQEVNRRQGAARNLGLRYASAEWIAFVDADDWLEPDYLERLYGPTLCHQLDVVACGFIRDAFDGKEPVAQKGQGTGKEHYIPVEDIEVKTLLCRYKTLGPGAWAKIVRKELLLEQGIFFPEGVVYEDSYWVPLLHLFVTAVYILEDCLYHYFWNPHSTVLAKGQMHHMDQLTVQMIKWRTYGERRLWRIYRGVLEHDLLWYAAAFMKTIILFWDEPPFPFFQLGREIMKQQVPDYREDPYIEDFSEVNRLLLEVLYSDIDKEGFRQVCGQLKALLTK